MINVVRFSIGSVSAYPNTIAEMFGLQGPDAYAYTSASNCLEVSGIDDTKDFHDTIVRSLQRHSFFPHISSESYGRHWSQPR
jgi:hypothetical protein